jgi:hypothetical protein
MLVKLVRFGCPLVFFVVFGSGAQEVLAQAAQAAPPAQSAADVSLPDAKAILERHIEAVGGRKALAARSSAFTQGTLNVPAQGMTGTIEIYAARPNKALVKTVIQGIGEVQEGFDGTTAWSINPMTGPTLVTGDELAQKAQDYEFDNSMNVASRYSSMKTLEKTTFDGRDCYKVSLVRKDGVEDIEFFDVATGLKAGSIASRKNPMGNIQVTSTFLEYKKFGDLLQATVLKQTFMGAEMVTTITSVEYDKVDPAVFELPAQIKALVKK